MVDLELEAHGTLEEYLLLGICININNEQTNLDVEEFLN